MRGNAVSNAVAPVSSDTLQEAIRKLSATLAFVNKTRPVPLTVRELMAENHQSRPMCHAAKGESLAVFPDGRLFPCSQTAGDTAFALGNVSSPKLQQQVPLEDGPDCPSRTHYNKGSNLPLCRLFSAERIRK
jgi:uncharacterized protein